MSVRTKIRYLNALLSLLPFGLIAIVYGLYGLFNYTGIESLKKVSGTTIYCGTKVIQSKVSSKMKEAFVISINTDAGIIECYTFVSKNKEKLKNLLPPRSENLNIWYDSKLDNLILQVELNGKIVLPYDPPYIAYIILIVVGLVFTIIPLLYLIQNPEEVSS